MRVLRRPTVGFTLIEMLVVIAIIGMLAGIIVPVVMSARKKAAMTQCSSNQRQAAMALFMYAQDNGTFPVEKDWYAAIGITDKKVLQCPSDTRSDPRVGFGMNAFLHGLKLDNIKRAQHTVCTVDSDESSTVSPDLGRHLNGAIFSHVDGSIVYAKKEEDGGR